MALAVPTYVSVGKDLISFNAHRMYGPILYPFLVCTITLKVILSVIIHFRQQIGDLFGQLKVPTIKILFPFFIEITH